MTINNNVEVIKVNFLGDTAKEQWKNAISIYRHAIQSNLYNLRNIAEEGDDYNDGYEVDVDAMCEDILDGLDNLERITENVLAEFERLVDGMFKEE